VWFLRFFVVLIF